LIAIGRLLYIAVTVPFGIGGLAAVVTDGIFLAGGAPFSVAGLSAATGNTIPGSAVDAAPLIGGVADSAVDAILLTTDLSLDIAGFTAAANSSALKAIPMMNNTSGRNPIVVIHFFI
jgi:hypothetical protein